MDVNLEFPFREKTYCCSVYMDDTPSSYPFYAFVVLDDKDLVAEFGEELAIKTDLDVKLPKKDDYPALVELRQSIFNVIKTRSEFIAIKARSGDIARSEQNSFRLSHEHA